MELVTFAIYSVIFIFLGITIGFSPLLYGMMLHFSSIGGKRQQRYQTALITGVLCGVLGLFVFGGSIAVYVQHLQILVMNDDAVRRVGIGLIGISCLVYAFRKTGTGKVKKTPNRADVMAISAIAFSRTVASISGLAATLVILDAITSHHLKEWVVFVIIGPVVAMAAIAPLLFIARGESVFPAAYTRVTLFFQTLTVYAEKKWHLFRKILASIGSVMIVYAIINLLQMLY